MARLTLSFLCLLALIGVLVLGFPNGADARIIGIVHDDSGSMEGKGTVHLPAFGPQFIISTLDGQTDPAKADRLFYALLNDRRVTAAPITSQSDQQGQIQRVRRLFSQPGGGTEIDMVARTLTEIVAQGRPGEEIFFVVVTDGEFSDNNLSAFRQAVARAAQTAKGPVRTEFVLINAANSNGLLSTVRTQGVYSALNSTFNGDPNDGFYNVTTFDEMFEAMRNITARISGTEEVGQGRNITVSGNTMTLESPFSISRIVAVSSTDDGSTPPQVVSKSFTETQSYTYTTGMDAPDNAPGWNKVMNGISQHFTFQPALAPGAHTLTFDQRLGPNSFLLFESEAVVELQIFDRNGVRLTPDANGLIEVSQNDEYDLQAQVYSQQSGTTPVAFSQLDPSASFKSDLIAPSGVKTSLPMSRNDPADRAEGKVTFSDLGEHGLQAVLRWPGFVSPTSRITRISVVDRQASLVVTPSPIETGPQGEMIVDVAPSGTPVPLSIGEVTVTDTAGIATAITLSLEGAPDWITLEGPGGQPLSRSDLVPIGANVSIIADGSKIDDGNKLRPWQFQIVAEAATPARGRAQAQVTVLPRLGEARVVSTGHSKDSTGTTALVMTGTELMQNTEGASGGIDALDFEIRDVLERPELGRNVEIVANPPFGVRLRPVITGNSLAVFPETSWWCPCFLYLTARPTTVAARYDDGKGLQSATSDVQVVDVKITVREAIVSCLLILGLILLILYLIKALMNGLSTQRFPKNSIAEIDDGAELTRKSHLRGRNFTFFKVLLWPIYGIPHEIKGIDGLVFQARRGGVNLLLTESKLDYESDTYDDLREFREDNPKKESVMIGWLEEFRSTSPYDKKIRLFREIGESR